jgi:HlyD family type I secretion membrane fusion protein
MAAARLEIPAAKSSLNASQELLLRVRQGAANGVIPRNRVAQVEEQAAQAQRTHTQLVTSLDLHAARVQRLEAEREALIARSAADARGQRADLIEQRDELRATEAAYRSRSRDIEVRAPVNGIVQKISETPVGTVIPAGGTVCEIVPTDGGVLIQARVSPRDIGFVSVGQKANVKSDAFDYSRFGTIPGEVARIAATNTPGELGQAPYIAVEIELDRPYVGTNETHVVTPGMTGEATILTGEKTVFQYLLKPIYTTLDTALHER